MEIEKKIEMVEDEINDLVSLIYGFSALCEKWNISKTWNNFKEFVQATQNKTMKERGI